MDISQEIQKLYGQTGISPEVHAFGEQIEKSLKERFDKIDKMAELNQLKVIHAMQEARVNAECFNYASGYGYNDFGRDTLEKVYANVFHTEDALVRPQITCGTHALALTLSANLRPGDELLSIAGKPYDTLEGYQTRPSFSVDQIGEAIAFVKKIKPEVICMVDNCYGEFVEEKEPSDVGADLVVGSLIKNPGGGLAPIGGYVAGRKDLIEQCAYRLTSPGLGKEVGASLGVMQSFYQGLFLAPTVVAGALKGAIFAANVYEKLGYAVVPDGKEERHDIIQAVTLGSAEGVIAFCQGIQAAAPVDSYVTPEPWAMPGYDSDVIMAAGAFVQGSSIELSADGPIKEPYAVYFQGGLTWAHAKLGILMSLQKLYEKGIVKEL